MRELEHNQDQTAAETTPLEGKLDAALSALQKQAEKAIRKLENKFYEANGSAVIHAEERGIQVLPSGIRRQSGISTIRYLQQAMAPGMVRLPKIVRSGQAIRQLFGNRITSNIGRFHPPEPLTNDEPIRMIDALRDAVKAMIFALEAEEPGFISRTRQDVFFEELESSEVGKKYLPKAVQELINFISEEAKGALLPVKQRAPEPDHFEKMLATLRPDEMKVMDIITRERAIQNTPKFRGKTEIKNERRIRTILTTLVNKKLVKVKEQGGERLYVHGQEVEPEDIIVP